MDRTLSSGAEAFEPEAFETEAIEALIPAEVIGDRVRELAAALDRDFGGRQPVLVAVLLGAFMFAADLIRHLRQPVHLDSLLMSSYPTGTRAAGRPKLLADLRTDIRGRHVIVLEDIVDSGQTMRAILQRLRRREPASLTAVALLDKPSRRQVSVPIHYVGFEIPPLFVVGYGLDCGGLYRNLPYLGVLERPDGRE